jgi:SNF2 family DNA or RNA helicase
MAALVKANIDYTSGWVQLRFPYNPQTVAILKENPGSKWDPNFRCWWVPLHGWAVISKQIQFEVPMTVERRAEIPSSVSARLRDYQVEAAHKLIANAGFLLTMEQRVGKTPTAIAALTALMGSNQARGAVVTFPGSVKGEWKRQLKQWANLDLVVLEGKKSIDEKEIARLHQIPYLVLGCGYEVLDAHADGISKVFFGTPHVIIGDELQRAKNRKGGIYRGFKKLADNQGVVARWGLSGTPMRNSPRDLWAMFDLTLPGSMGSYWKYAIAYCAAVEGDYGWEDKGISNPEILEARLRAHSYRKTRAEVAAHLPKSDRAVIQCEVRDSKVMKHYKKLERALATSVSKGLAGADPSSNQYEAIRQLCQVTSQGKIPTALERISLHLARGVKVLVFAHFHETLKLLEKRLAEDAQNGLFPYPVFCAGGWDTINKRLKTIQEWKDTQGPAVILLNSVASGIGIDLSDAEVAIFLELEWVPADFRQAEDRIQDVHLGKRTTPPLYEYLIVKDTIDERMAATLLRKIRNNYQVTGKNDVESQHVAATLRQSGVIDVGRMGLENTDKETVQAAIQSAVSRWLSADDDVEKSDSDELAGDFSDWDDEPKETEEAAV